MAPPILAQHNCPTGFDYAGTRKGVRTIAIPLEELETHLNGTILRIHGRRAGLESIQDESKGYQGGRIRVKLEPTDNQTFQAKRRITPGLPVIWSSPARLRVSFVRNCQF